MLASSVASTLGVQVALDGAARAATAPSMGPISPDTNFPTWYGDATGKRLELCLTGAPNCLAAATDLVAPDGEAFYFNANTTLPTPAGKSLLVLGTEAAFAAAGAGQESAFNRTRIRINTSDPGDFTVTWPYGQKTYHVDTVDPFKFEINETIDLGCIAAPPDNTCNDATAPNFSDVTASLQPFLQWDPAVAPAPPAGFIGDAATPHKVVGSPTGNNVFRVDGPNIGGPGVNTIQTDQFLVQGKLAGPLSSDPAHLNLGTQTIGAKTSQTLTLKNIGPASLTVTKSTPGKPNPSIDPTSANATDFTATGCDSKALATDTTCTVTVTFTPSAAGERDATLLVAYTTTPQINSPLQIPLTGFGRAANTAPTADITPTSIDFGTVHVGAESTPTTVSVKNNGTAPLNISKIALSGANPGEFRFASVDCQPKGGLLPGDGCQISVASAPVHGGARSASLVVTDDAGNSPQSIALTTSGDPGLVGFGPVDPKTQFPAWYEDKTGLKMAPCLDGVPPCFTAAADLTAPAGEGFYMGADALMDTPGGGKTRLVLSTEAAYAGSGTGQEITFNRIRFFATAGLRPGAQYRVTHPYGTDTYVADSSGAVLRKNATQDIGCVAPPCNPGGWGLLEQSRVGPFLRWDPAQAPAAPLGYVSDGATLHRVVGSPYNTNIFRVEGAAINPNPTVDACPTLPAAAKADPNYSPANCIETDQFTLQGKILPPGPLAFSPDPTTTYSGPQQVSLSTTAGPLTDDTGVKIYYTTDGTEPSLASTAYTAPFTVSATTTVKAIAVNADGGVSRGTATFTLGAASVAVTARPAGGIYPAAQLVTLAASDPTASIYYTEDGSIPTTSSTQYVPGSSINVASSKTLKFIGVLGSGQPQVFSETYTIANDKSDVSSVLGTDGFPTWYQDTTGLRLEPCFDPTLCFAVLPDPNAALAFPTNYPDEVFYFGSKALLPSVGSGGKGDLVLSTEAAFLPGPHAANGQQVTFNRIRVKASGLVPGETYTVKHPYGVETLKADAKGAILITEDVGCAAAPCDFRAALAGRVTPWLNWTGAKPAGYIGGGAAVTSTVTGSPVGFNKFRIEGPNAGGAGVNFVETDQFSVQGKIAGPSIVAAPKGGTYATAQSVTLSSNDPNARIYYSIDGKTAPSPTDTTGATQPYTAPISISATTTLKAIAVNAAGTSSAVLSEVYTIDAAAPTVAANPASTVQLPVSVTLTSSKLGNIYYTTDGKTTPSPTDTSGTTRIYSAPIAISTPTVLKFVAVDGSTGTPSAVGTETYGDVIAPTVSLSAPASGATVSGAAVAVSASATDNVGVVGVQFRLDGANLGAEVTAAPYSVNWDTTPTANGQHTLSAIARDAAGNTATAAPVTVTVSNVLDTTPPSAPSGLTATAASTSQINLSWTASTDNVGVAGYNVYRDGVSTPINGTTLVSSTTFSDAGLAASSTHAYTVQAVDTAGNASAASTSASASTQAAPDTQAPSVPSGLTATAASTSQINLSWTASTDNVGVVGYRVYRDAAPAAIATVTTGTTFSDAGLAASSSHSYSVDAFDAAGNSSAKAGPVSATTQAPPVTAPAVSFTPSQLAFGSVTAGSTVTRTVTVANTGTAALTIQSIGISGADAANFSISANTCSGAGVTVPAGGSCSVSVTFTAKAPKRLKTAALNFVDNAGTSPQTVTLQGTVL